MTPCWRRSSYANGGAQFILLVEKDAAFMRLAEDRFYNKCVQKPLHFSAFDKPRILAHKDLEKKII